MHAARTIALALLAAACVAASAADGTASAPDTATRYHGFLLDTGSADARIDADDPSLARQIAIVEAVDVPVAVRDFFRGVPIRVDRNLPTPPGQFVRQGASGFVRILPDDMDGDKPILLHELLHAYHDEVVGIGNPEIGAAYTRAKRASDYPARFQSAHFLENGFEYFAVTSTIFLFGPIRQPPFDCRVLRATDPGYLAFLASLFGQHACR